MLHAAAGYPSSHNFVIVGELNSGASCVEHIYPGHWAVAVDGTKVNNNTVLKLTRMSVLCKVMICICSCSMNVSEFFLWNWQSPINALSVATKLLHWSTNAILMYLAWVVYMVPAAVMPSVFTSERSHFKIKAAILLPNVAVRLVHRLLCVTSLSKTYHLIVGFMVATMTLMFPLSTDYNDANVLL